MTNGSSDRIHAELAAWVAAAPAGTRLPSSRTLSARHGASPVTVQKVLHRLAAAGLVESRPGVGTFVRRRAPRGPVDLGWQSAALGAPHVRYPRASPTQRSADPDAVALHSGYPVSDLLPAAAVRAALARAARSEASVRRAPAAGLLELRAWFAADLAGDGGFGTAASPVSARDVLVLPGSQSGLSAIFRAIVGRDRPLVVESPTYWGAVVAAAQAGVELVPVPSGPHGPDPEEVASAMDRTGARAFYAQPTWSNPHGARWSDDRARAVLDVVRARSAFLVEDDWAHDFGIDAQARPLARMDDGGHVIHLRSLTKSLSPAVRVGAVIARGPARDRIEADLAAGTMYVSGVLQAAALDVVTQPAWRTHLRALGPRLRARRDGLLAALRTHLPEAAVDHVPTGGLSLWVRLPEGTDLEKLTRAAAARRVLIAPGDEWFPAEPSGPHIRLTYSGPEPERYPSAVAAIAEALREQRG
ncbi:PLP-dependent aminotransferase family protein [Litorihabitans aurantiacus]|uniref:GntR family transcriptional regulator n=1 Tax=Litorihabitans aurantiacus TaxID=1930061 RepID=A0AA37XGL2_9MICO|nr:PLP-dependent aminotransferase family protein [Litorihabitans aurantiacus]GMA32941.1 GntR family transcriptional regulator [Litorihabitans aurantiacus]